MGFNLWKVFLYFFSRSIPFKKKADIFQLGVPPCSGAILLENQNRAF